MTVWPRRLGEMSCRLTKGSGLSLSILMKARSFFWIAGDVTRLVTLLVVRDDLDFQIGGALDDVFVRHDVTARIDQKPEPRLCSVWRISRGRLR